MRAFFTRFWAWYERHYLLNVGIAVGLFLLQIVHLWWLTADVVFFGLFEERLWVVGEAWRYIIIAVDYTEIPALFSVSLLYIHELRSGWSWRPVLMLLFLNSQWLHLFWITDEFVVDSFFGIRDTILPIWVAWIAIFIDYLELPVMVDTVYKFIRSSVPSFKK
jgi:hypothetical protein